MNSYESEKVKSNSDRRNEDREIRCRKIFEVKRLSRMKLREFTVGRRGFQLVIGSRLGLDSECVYCGWDTIKSRKGRERMKT